MGEDHAQDEAAIRTIIQQCADAWTAGDAAAFSAPFAEDAGYVVINGMYITGRAAINTGHTHLFSTIYQDSHLTATVEDIRFVRSEVAVVHVQTRNQHKQGEINARSTWVLAKDRGAWEIVAFQNTPITAPGP